jgi:hypothetical protein
VEYKYGDTKLVRAVIQNNVMDYELCVRILNFPKLNTFDEYFCNINTFAILYCDATIIDGVVNGVGSGGEVHFNGFVRRIDGGMMAESSWCSTQNRLKVGAT